jgi:hypothetical protein
MLPSFSLSIHNYMASCNTNTVINGPTDPNFLASNYYFFSVTRIPNLTYSVQSANLPSIGMGVINQPSNLGLPPKIPATNYSFGELEVSFLVNAQMTNWLEIYNWMKGIGNLKDDTTNLNYDPASTSGVFSDGTLLVTNSAYKPILQASFKYLFPKSLGDISFNTQTTTNEPVKCSVTFAYSYYEILPV